MKAKEHRQPPRFANDLLNWYCQNASIEDLEGDMEELFHNNLDRMSATKAKMKYWQQVMSLIFSYAIKKRKQHSAYRSQSYRSIQPVMLRNYFKIAARNFLKQKIYTMLNVLGLAVGMAASLLIFQYVKYEKNFDSFHSRIGDLYRIQYNGWQNGKREFESALAVPTVGPALKSHLPEIVEFVRFYPGRGAVSYEDPMRGPISFYESKMFYSDASIFKMFDFPLLIGDTATCLKGTDKMVIGKTAAAKYFGDEDPIGKTIKWQGGNYEVTGVLKDVPENSHFRFEFLISMETLVRDTNNMLEDGWGWYDFYVYVLLRPHADVAEVQKKWNAWLASDREEEWKKENAFQEFILQPLADIHLNSQLLYEAHPAEQRDGKSIAALSLIAIFILAIACINYVNLATARSINRANEVGIRKVVGAYHQQLLGQFMMESALLNLVAFSIAIIAVRLTWSEFSALSGWNIPLDFLFHADFWKLAVMLFIGGTLVSGFYPALVLSSFRPVVVLKGKSLHFSGGARIRKTLVIFQFVTSLLLIIGSVIVYDQVTFMRNKDLGMDIRHKLIVRTPTYTDSTYFNRVQSFKNESLKVEGVKSIAAAVNIPGDEIVWTSHVGRISGGPEGDLIITSVGIDDQYVPTFDIKTLEGRNFDHAAVDEHKHVLVNKSLVRDLEFPDVKSAIGEKLRVRQSMTQYDTLEIVGVVDDYHHMSLQAKMLPSIFRYTPYANYFALKIESPNYAHAIVGLENEWKSFFPGNPFDYFILDQFFDHQYDKQYRFAKLFNLFTAMAIFIALLGLFGLASFVTIQRTKEIGIRKVLGSPVSGIVLLLSRGFLQPVLVANLIAWPLAWFVMNRWLEEFPYRTAINPIIFPAAGACVVLLAFLFVGIQTLKAAMAQPVKTLKYE